MQQPNHTQDHQAPDSADRFGERGKELIHRMRTDRTSNADFRSGEAHAARVLVWAARPNLGSMLAPFNAQQNSGPARAAKKAGDDFRRAAENGTQAACAPRTSPPNRVHPRPSAVQQLCRLPLPAFPWPVECKTFTPLGQLFSVSEFQLFQFLSEPPHVGSYFFGCVPRRLNCILTQPFQNGP